MSNVVPIIFLAWVAGMFLAMLYLTLEIALDPDGEGQTWVIWPALKRFIGRSK